MTGDQYMVGAVCSGAFVFGIMMFLNLFWVKYFIRTGEVCDGILPLCEFKKQNFCYNPDSSDLVIFTFFRTVFGFIASVAIGFSWIVTLWFFLFMFIAWVHKELPKGYTLHRRNGRW